MSNEQPAVLATIVEGWNTYLGELRKALAPLTPEQLAWRPAPNLRSIGEIATHMIGARARWFNWLLGEGDTEIADMAPWDRPGGSVRTADELVHALDATWQL